MVKLPKTLIAYTLLPFLFPFQPTHIQLPPLLRFLLLSSPLQLSSSFFSCSLPPVKFPARITTATAVGSGMRPSSLVGSLLYFYFRPPMSSDEFWRATFGYWPLSSVQDLVSTPVSLSLPLLFFFSLILGEIEKGLSLGFLWPTGFEEIDVQNL